MGRSISGDTTSNPSRSVLSVDGFQTGDLIYETSGNVGRIPDNFVSVGTFNATSDQVRQENNFSTIYSSKNVFEPELNILRSFGTGRPSATLSNGNIVTVFFQQLDPQSNGTSAQFKDVYISIDQPDGTSVLAPTVIHPSGNSDWMNYENSCLDVVASSSGGFAVVWSARTSFYPAWAVCDNNGTVLNLSQKGTTYYKFKIETFNASNTYSILAVNPSNTAYMIRVSNSGELGTTTVTGNITYNGNIDMCSLSDNTVGFVYSQGNRLYYRNYNQSNTLLVSETNTSPSGLGTWFEVTCASNSLDQVCIVVASNNGNGKYMQFRKADGKVSGGWGEFIYLNNTINNLAATQHAANYTGNIPDTNNFFYTVAGNKSIQTRAIDYEGNSLGPVLYNLIHQASQGSRVLIKAGSELRYYASSGSQAINDYRIYGYSLGVPQYTVINSETYTPDGENSVESIVTTTTASVSGYVKSSATPKTAKFYASTTATTSGVLDSTTSSGTVSKNITSLNFQCWYVKGLELDNGNIAIVYVTGTCTIRLKIIDSNYAEISDTLLQTSNSTNGRFKFDLARLNNGKIIVVHAGPDYRTLLYRVYSSTMALEVDATELDLSGQTIVGSAQAIAVCSLAKSSQTGFAVSFAQANSYPFVITYNTTDFLPVSSRLVRSATIQSQSSMSMVTDAQGYLYHSADYSSSGFYCQRSYINPVSLSSSSFVTMEQRGATNYARLNSEVCVLSDGTITFPWADTSGQDGIIRCFGTSTSDRISGDESTSRGDNWGSVQNVTGDGKWFMFQNRTVGSYSGVLWTLSAESGEANFRNYSNGVIAPTSSNSSYSYAACGIPSRGSKAHIIYYNDTEASHSIFQIRVAPEGYILNTVSGVTESAVLPLNENTSPLIGVAVQDCAAGEVGLVQTKGSASLNTNYPSSTSESFDFRTQTADGVKGFISGRNISLGD